MVSGVGAQRNQRFPPTPAESVGSGTTVLRNAGCATRMADFGGGGGRGVRDSTSHVLGFLQLYAVCVAVEATAGNQITRYVLPLLSSLPLLIFPHIGPIFWTRDYKHRLASPVSSLLEALIEQFLLRVQNNVKMLKQ